MPHKKSTNAEIIPHSSNLKYNISTEIISTWAVQIYFLEELFPRKHVIINHDNILCISKVRRILNFFTTKKKAKLFEEIDMLIPI